MNNSLIFSPSRDFVFDENVFKLGIRFEQSFSRLVCIFISKLYHTYDSFSPSHRNVEEKRIR